MTDIEFAAILISYGALLACGIGLIVYSIADAFFPLSGSRRRRRP